MFNVFVFMFSCSCCQCLVMSSGSSYVVEETAGTLSFTVRRSYGLFGNVTLLLSTADGSAVANVDYVPL